MGKALVKLGLWIQGSWVKMQCKWNWLISKLMLNVESCPNKLCKCKD
jgi:hypothetical protein